MINALYSSLPTPLSLTVFVTDVAGGGRVTARPLGGATNPLLFVVTAEFIRVLVLMGSELAETYETEPVVGTMGRSIRST